MSNYKQKPYTQEEKWQAVEQFADKIDYSPRYATDEWEYRHVKIPKELLRFCPPGICSEEEWRGLGIRQSLGWEMYMRHEPEPHVLLFRRPKNFDAVQQSAGKGTIAPQMISAGN